MVVPTVRYNESTGKVCYIESTDTVCQCPNIGSSCSNCPTPSQTPKRVRVRISGMSDCPGCRIGRYEQDNCGSSTVISPQSAQIIDEISSSVNGIHTLVQDSDCSWSKDISGDWDIKVYTADGGPYEDHCVEALRCFTIELTFIRITLTRGSTFARVTIEGSDPVHGLNWPLADGNSGTCEVTGTDCFDCADMPVSFDACNESPTGLGPLLSEGTWNVI